MSGGSIARIPTGRRRRQLEARRGLAALPDRLKGLLKSALRAAPLRGPLRPVAAQARGAVYAARYALRTRLLEARYPHRVRRSRGVAPEAAASEIWRALVAALPDGVSTRTVSVAQAPHAGQDYWLRYRGEYAGIGHGREKALEHSLTFSLLDLSRARRFCDVAAAQSPIAACFRQEWPGVEFWKQDCLYRTDLGRRVIGGFAQDMQGVPDGHFDGMSLHCSFEHFSGAADGEFLRELDRVLSPVGACLILPLYLDLDHRIYLDPTVIPLSAVRDYDPEATLYSAYGYRQEHGRTYGPESLVRRVLSKVPPGLKATVIRFTGQESLGPEIYLRFGLVLSRPESLLR